jgi:hypothetical protein
MTMYDPPMLLAISKRTIQKEAGSDIAKAEDKAVCRRDSSR